MTSEALHESKTQEPIGRSHDRGSPGEAETKID